MRLSHESYTKRNLECSAWTETSFLVALVSSWGLSPSLGLASQQSRLLRTYKTTVLSTVKEDRIKCDRCSFNEELEISGEVSALQAESPGFDP